jgi:hypothetical protein
LKAARRFHSYTKRSARRRATVYVVNPAPLRDVDAWLDRFRRFWTPHLDAPATELARGKRQRRVQHHTTGEPKAAGGPTSSWQVARCGSN